MTASDAPRRLPGKIAIAALGIGIAAVLAGYLFTLPEPWLRSFGAEIAYRAEADPNPPLPEDSRQELRREPVENRLICMANIISRPWDAMVVVQSGQALGAHAVLGSVQWPGRDDAERLLNDDDRYQMIVLLDRGAVIDHQLFYTFWGDLSALAQRPSFSAETAIFSAQSRGGRYSLSIAAGASLSDCPPVAEVRR